MSQIRTIDRKRNEQRADHLKMVRDDSSREYYRTPFRARDQGKRAEYKRAEALYNEDRLVHSDERAAVYGKLKLFPTEYSRL